MYNLILQIFTAGQWHDAMTLDFDDPEKGFESRCSFGYEAGYLGENIAKRVRPARFPASSPITCVAT